MANTFKNSSITNVSTETNLFTVASGKVVTIISLSLANVTTGDIQVTVKLDSTHLIKNTIVPTGSTLIVSGMDQKNSSCSRSSIKSIK